MNKKQISINMASGLIASILTLTISFLLTPYLVKNLGDEAYGYIGLSSTFVTIASVFTTALNSMANRFILIAYENRKEEKVNEYFSSLFVSGAGLAVIFSITGMLVSLNIDKIFNIATSLLPVVKLTFVISIINFSVMTILTVFTASVFIKNRMDLTARFDIIANGLKVIFLLFAFSLFTPQIYFVSIGGLIYTLVLYFGHVYNTKKLLPNIKINIVLAKIETIKELVFSGIWNSFGSLTQLLMVGMDLALANWTLDGRAMGLISISSTITIALNSVLGIVIGVFKPILAKTYVKGDLEKLHEQVKVTTRFQAMIMFVPLIGVCIFSSKFYRLWMPYKSNADIVLLSAITFTKIFDQLTGLTVESISTNFYLFNKLKTNTICRLLVGLINIPVVIIFVNIFNKYNLNILAISGISTVLYLLYYWIVVPQLASKTTMQKNKEYYKMIFGTVKFAIVLSFAFFIINYFTICDNWLSFTIVVALTGLLGYILMFVFGLKKEEKLYVYDKVKQITGRRKNG